MWQSGFSGQRVPVDRHTSESSGQRPPLVLSLWSGSPVLQSKVPDTGSTSDVLLLPLETKYCTQKPDVWEEKSVPCTQPCGLEVQRRQGALCEETRACLGRVQPDWQLRAREAAILGGVTPSGSLLECAEVGEAQRQITLGHSPASYLSQNSKLPELQHHHLMLPWELILKQMIFLVPGFFSPTYE